MVRSIPVRPLPSAGQRWAAAACRCDVRARVCEQRIHAHERAGAVQMACGDSPRSAARWNIRCDNVLTRTRHPILATIGAGTPASTWFCIQSWQPGIQWPGCIPVRRLPAQGVVALVRDVGSQALWDSDERFLDFSTSVRSGLMLQSGSMSRLEKGGLVARRSARLKQRGAARSSAFASSLRATSRRRPACAATTRRSRQVPQPTEWLARRLQPHDRSQRARAQRVTLLDALRTRW